MKKLLTACLLAALALPFMPAAAWSNHYLFNRAALEPIPELATKVKVESLEDFLLKEKEGLVALMAQIESDAKLSYAKAAPQPEALAFKGGDAGTIRNNFLRALRVNPNTPLGFYLAAVPGQKLPGKPSNPQTVSLFGDKDLKGVYLFYDVRKGESVSALDVLATAGDEPDFGQHQAQAQGRGPFQGRVTGPRQGLSRQVSGLLRTAPGSLWRYCLPLPAQGH